MSVCVRCACALVVLCLTTVQADEHFNVSVVWKPLSFEETHELVVNSSVEYILPFVPNAGQSYLPVRIWIRTDGGDTARPLLVTASRRIGATTWQLPYRLGDDVLFELERTLCPEDSVEINTLHDDCDDSSSVRGQFSLHIGSSCAASTTVQLRATFIQDWRLPFESSTVVHIWQGAPRVHYYNFVPEQRNVRLVLESEDDVCATVAVQNYTCPIAETLEDMGTSTLRFTMMRSGGVQLSRSRYPRGFYVVLLVRDTDEACREEEAPGDDWLWEAAVLHARQPQPRRAPPTHKTIILHTRAALTRAQYAWGAAASLALFLLFYVCCGALVLAQRLPRWKALVGPRAVLAAKSDVSTRTEVESPMSVSSARRRRRDSTATFDSSDNSDTDDEMQETGTATTAATAHGETHGAGGVSSGDPANNTNNSINNVAGGDHSFVTAGDVNTDPDADIQHMPTDRAAQGTNGIYVVDANADPSRQSRQSRQSRPFGLPARLHVAALARRRARVLSARSDRYLYTLYTVGLFYALPVLQFVVAFQIMLNLTGSLDTCYYNFLCAHPVGELADFNHVLSNLGYLLLGALFMLQVRRRKLRRHRKPRDEEYGIPAHYGLLSSLGAAMMMVALLSATYHICPNRLNFQFDTAFMYVLAVLSMVKIYQSRHPDINARAHATFGVLAVLILLVVWGVLGGGPLFWGVCTVLHVFTFLLLTLRIYYVGQFRLEKQSLQVAARSLAALPARGLRPLYTARLVMLLIANAINWGFALYGLFTQSADIASHLLSVLLVNTLMYMVFYLTMKLLHGERPRWYAWLYLCGATAAWVPGLYFFVSGSTDWSTTPALSRHMNHECRVLQLYDSHDLWHMLSAVALYFTFNVLLTWDDGLANVKRTEIAVF